MGIEARIDAATGRGVERVWRASLACCAAVLLAGSSMFGARARAESVPAGSVPEGVDWRQEYIQVADPQLGAYRLHADVYRPAGQQGTVPVIVEVTPSAGTFWNARSSSTSDGPRVDDEALLTVGRIVQQGFALAIVDAPGYGASGGCDDWFGPAAHRAAVAAVAWARDTTLHPWASGRVAAYGGSFQGAFALMAMTAGVDAAIVQSPAASTRDLVFTNGNVNPLIPIDAAANLGYEVVPPSPFAAQVQLVNHETGRTAGAKTCAGADPMVHVADPTDAYWDARDWVRATEGTRVPVLFSQGLRDGSVRDNSLVRLWSGFAGPKWAWIANYDHEPAQAAEYDEYCDQNPATCSDVRWPEIGRRGFLVEAAQFLRTFLRGEDPRSSGLSEQPLVAVGEAHGRWRDEPTWPIENSTLALTVLPGTYRNAPENWSELRGEEDEHLGQTTPVPPGMAGNGAWSVSAPLTMPVHLTGEPRITAQLDAGTSPSVTIDATVYEISADGAARVVSRGVTTRPANGTMRVTFPTYPADWEFAAGTRIGLLLAGSDLRWAFTPGATGLSIGVVSGRAELPLETCPYRRPLLDGGVSAAYRSLRPISAPTTLPPAPTSIVFHSCSRSAGR
jgi:predicted acyl esterase